MPSKHSMIKYLIYEETFLVNVGCPYFEVFSKLDRKNEALMTIRKAKFHALTTHTSSNVKHN